MAMSVNGYIAKGDNETPWSDEEWQSFSEKVKEFGCLIIGRKTYEIMRENDEFQKINNPLTVVISKQEIKEESPNFVFVNSAKDALQVLEERAFDKVLIFDRENLKKVMRFSTAFVCVLFCKSRKYLFPFVLSFFNQNCSINDFLKVHFFSIPLPIRRSLQTFIA